MPRHHCGRGIHAACLIVHHEQPRTRSQSYVRANPPPLLVYMRLCVDAAVGRQDHVEAVVELWTGMRCTVLRARSVVSRHRW